MILKYKGVSVTSVNLTIELSEKAGSDVVDSAQMVHDALREYRVGSIVDIDESTNAKILAYLKFDTYKDSYCDDITPKGICRVAKAYSIAKLYFPKVMVTLFLDKIVDGEGDTIKLSLDSFLDLCKWQMNLYNEEV